MTLSRCWGHPSRAKRDEPLRLSRASADDLCVETRSTTSRRRRSRSGFAVLGALLAFAASSCSSGSTSESVPSTTAPTLDRTVSLNGISIRVPSYFQVSDPEPCIQGGNAVEIEIPGNWVGCEPFANLHGTSILLSTDEVLKGTAKARELLWQQPRLINGVTVVEDASWNVNHCPGPPCYTYSGREVQIPSHDVGMIIMAAGETNSGSLDLADQIVNSIRSV